ncbi:MAG: serine/threonine protein kinase [Polyangiaceae bacterium]|nr:serine/threonine protein kinase [Polyangiaceae bacterium]
MTEGSKGPSRTGNDRELAVTVPPRPIDDSRSGDDPLVPVPVPRTRPWGVSITEPPHAAPFSETLRTTDPTDNVIRGGAAANPALDELVGSTAPPREDRLGRVIAGRYRLERRLGAGGVGAVFLASTISTGRKVAVKLLRRELCLLPEVEARFEREAAAASRIDHPNVAGALDFGRLEDGSLFLVLEYVEGASLATLLANEGPLPSPRALRIARAIAAALGAAHRAGIVHRDLKPDNVMLTEEPGADTVKVVDFGIAQITTDPSGRAAPAVRATITGTPEYMAPEQATGTIVDHRADLYTLGIVLFEMLVGHPPFRGDSMDAVLHAQLTEPPPELPSTIDLGTSALTAQLLAKDPDLRPPTAEDVARRIDGLLDPNRDPGSQREPNSAPPSREVPSQPHSPPDSAPSPRSSERDGESDLIAAAVSSRSPVSRRVSPPIASPNRHRRQLGLGCVAVLVVAIAVAVVVRRDRRTAVGFPRPPLSSASADGELRALAARAETGEAAALAALEETRSPSALTHRALGRGYARRGAASSSIAAYDRALALDPGLASDTDIARDVRRAIDDPSAAEAALELALKRLGPTGVDIAHDVWSEARRDASSSALASRSKELLDDPRVSARASPALAISLALWAGTTCESYRALLPRAEAVADERSLPVLNSLGRTQGCGPHQRLDCFACLREDDALARATAAAATRPAPRF